MSIDIRWLTNGQKTAWTVLHTDTGEVEKYDRLEHVPESIRHYCKAKEPLHIGPDGAFILGVNKVFYPDWPLACGHPDYADKRCIAESCKFGSDGDWTKCPFFSGRRLETST